MPWYSTIPLVALSLVSVLKVLAIAHHMIYAYHHRDEIWKGFRPLYKKKRSGDEDGGPDLRSLQTLLQTHRTLFVFEYWPEFRFVEHLGLKPWTIKYLFYVPTLAAIWIIVAFCSKNNSTSLCASMFALALLLFYALQMVVMRFALGPCEIFFRIPSTTRKNVKPTDLLSPNWQLLAEYFRILGVLIVLVVIAYASAYFAVSKMCPISFHDAACDPTKQISQRCPPLDRRQALYFSIVTFGTVGFGDINPQNDLTRTLVASEIGLAFMLVALLIAVYSITTTGD